MSLVGATAAGLPSAIHGLRTHGHDAVDHVIRMGDLPSELSGHLPMTCTAGAS
jgi:hypothetical protein